MSSYVMSRVSGADAGGQKKSSSFRLVGWEATLPADHTPTPLDGGDPAERPAWWADRPTGTPEAWSRADAGHLLNAISAATSAALIKPALSQPRSLGNADATSCVVDVEG